MRGDIRRGIEPQPGDDGVSVTVARVDRYPFAAAAFAKITKLGRTDWRFEQAGSAECCSDALVSLRHSIAPDAEPRAGASLFAPRFVGR